MSGAEHGQSWQEAEWRRQLLTEVQRQSAGDTDPDPGALLRWLARTAGVEAVLVDGSGAIAHATAEFPRTVLERMESILERLHAGERAVVQVQDARTDGLQLRLESLGGTTPRFVLVSALPPCAASDADDLLAQTAGVLPLLLQAENAVLNQRRYRYTARRLRFAVFTALMTGETDLARRMTADRPPGVLDAGTVRVQILQCSPEERERLTLEVRNDARTAGLMVHCPVYSDHIIRLIADDTDSAGRRTRHAEPSLLRLVRKNPGYLLGTSDPQPLQATSHAYGQALHALAVARNTPERTATYSGGASLAAVLPQAQAAAWAAGYLRPIRRVSGLTRDITTFGVTFPRAAVARLLGISRNTVAAHLAGVEKALGIDLGDVRARATLHLAMVVDATVPGSAQSSAPVRHAPSLEGLLSTSSAAAWAQAFLGRLEQPVLSTVDGWIAAGTDARKAAAELGVNRNTVRTRLRTAERLLSRDLLTSGSGVHDVLHALMISEIHRS